MGFKFRKSVKIAPGVRINFGKKSTGISIGNRGGGVSFNTRSGARVRASIPGTGISYSSKVGGKGRGKRKNSKGCLYYFLLSPFYLVYFVCFFPFIALYRMLKNQPQNNAKKDAARPSSGLAAYATPDNGQPQTQNIQIIKEPLDKISAVRSFKDYVIVDTETTGLSPTRDRIIEIGIMEVRDGVPGRTYETLINPGVSISEAASKVNGIYNKDVADAPKMEQIATEIWPRLSADILVAYNAPFDTGFIANEMERHGMSGTIRYTDAMTIAKRAYPGLSNYKLATVAAHLGYDAEQRHRALDDVKMTQFVLEKSLQKILSDHDKELKLAKEKKEKEAELRTQRYARSPLVNKTFAFTGDFKMEREQLENMLDGVGGILKETVIKKLDYIVVGDLKNLPDWALERKIKKAEKYIAEGCPIEKITEGEYLRMVGEALTALQESSE